MRTWIFPLFECRNLHKYACALFFPCVPMNTVRHLLQREYGASDFESTAAAAAAVTLVDAPCLAGAMALNRHVGRFLWDSEEDVEEAEEDTMSKIGAAMACMVYPLLVCPTTCWLRRRVVHEAGVEDESLWKTGQIAMCCWPCGLVQMEDEMQGEAHTSKGMKRSLTRMPIL